MWGLLGKKNNNQDGKILNEREIQEKLYGKYRVPAKEKPIDDRKLSAPESPLVAVAPIQAETPRAQPSIGVTVQTATTESPKRNSTNAFSASTNYNRYSAAASNSKKIVRLNLSFLKNPTILKSIFGVGIAIAVILVAQKAWLRLSENHSKHQIQEPSIALPGTVVSTGAPTQGRLPALSSSIPQNPVAEDLTSQAVKALPVVENSSAKASASTNQTDLADIEGKPFSIQVCTYRLEHDAKKLVERLKEENMPAYYQASPTKREQSPRFYLVFVGREETYQDAQSALAKFKQSSLSKEFPDAYIRKL